MLELRPTLGLTLSSKLDKIENAENPEVATDLHREIDVELDDVAPTAIPALICVAAPMRNMVVSRGAGDGYSLRAGCRRANCVAKFFAPAVRTGRLR